MVNTTTSTPRVDRSLRRRETVLSPPALGHTDRRGAPLFFEGQPQLPVGDDGNINFVFGSQAPGGLDPSEFPSGSAHEPRSLERELLLFPAQWIPASNLLCSSLAEIGA